MNCFFLLTIIERTMHNFKRRRVNQLPAGARHWKMLNHLKLNRCFLGVDAGFAIEFELFFNHDYGSDDVIHWCLGCCDNDEAAFDNALRLLEIALCSFYDVPLLYRWKHFPLAVSYVKLGMTPHKILLRVMRLVLQDLTAEKLAEYQQQQAGRQQAVVKLRVNRDRIVEYPAGPIPSQFYVRSSN